MFDNVNLLDMIEVGKVGWLDCYFLVESVVLMQVLGMIFVWLDYISDFDMLFWMFVWVIFVCVEIFEDVMFLLGVVLNYLYFVLGYQEVF